MSNKTAVVAPKENTRGRVLFASLIGTTIEFFDFYAYATASVLVFPTLFFPNASNVNAILSSFAIFGVAFVARPVGSVLFGHFGDKVGRKGTLVASLLLMGIATFLIGFLPAAQGNFVVLAPLMLVLLRFAQGLALGGEWSGAALLATENAPANKRAIYGTFPQLGAPIGFIIANLMFVGLQLGLTPEQFMDWGWRVPFILSAVMVAVGLWVRLKLVESLSFQKVVAQDKVAKSPFKTTMKYHWRPVLAGTFIMLATYVLFYLTTAFTLTYGTAPATVEAARAAAEAKGKVFDAAAEAAFVPGLGIARPEFLTMLIIGVVFFGIFTVVSGPLAEKFGRRKFLIWVTLGILLFGATWTLMFGPGKGAAMAGLVIGFTLMGLTFGPMAAYLPELFPSNVRYTGSAVAYNMSSVIGAAPASFVAIALWQFGGGNTVWVGVYLAAAAVLTLIALFLTKDTTNVDYENNVS
ncbi:MFS transporter [Paeniglutamicibacter psychrophenolicus]|uniref:MFS family permease n=1 Tax=Paeniglutamicibacter psychrophenolicus TaxID=257454 RepID=A0ABS4WK06_9MICC|nr:MFS transporter [Paeniglutamicibacter psychrophenolicus]MBP2375894.1 MFS family permease [Paeniglutamicibacter psychrophenolicus]